MIFLICLSNQKVEIPMTHNLKALITPTWDITQEKMQKV